MGLQHPLFLCSRSNWLRWLPLSKHGRWSGRKTNYQHQTLPMQGLLDIQVDMYPVSLSRDLGMWLHSRVQQLDNPLVHSIARSWSILFIHYSLTYWLTYLKLGVSSTAPPPPHPRQHGELHEAHMTPPDQLLRLPTWWGASQTTWNPPRNWVPFLALKTISTKMTILYLEYVISPWTLI